MKLIVVRHASTAFNEQGIINGQFDESLSEKGQKEIPYLVEKLHLYELDTIYTSPLTRARQTAKPIAKDHGLEITIDQRIMEVNMGIFTKKTFESTSEVLGKASGALLNSYDYDLRAYGGESAKEVQRRISSFINDIKNSDHNSVLVVTHGGIIRWFYYLCNGQKVGRFPNASIHQFNM
jgi:alpha-ribazole phosphatase